jgi:hypothetical protein
LYPELPRLRDGTVAWLGRSDQFSENLLRFEPDNERQVSTDDASALSSGVTFDVSGSIDLSGGGWACSISTHPAPSHIRPSTLSPARRFLDAFASVGHAGFVEGRHPLGAVAREAYGATIGVGRCLASIGLLIANTPVLVR